MKKLIFWGENGAQHPFCLEPPLFNHPLIPRDAATKVYTRLMQRSCQSLEELEWLSTTKAPRSLTLVAYWLNISTASSNIIYCVKWFLSVPRQFLNPQTEGDLCRCALTHVYMHIYIHTHIHSGTRRARKLHIERSELESNQTDR